jgi:hypothetical protein
VNELEQLKATIAILQRVCSALLDMDHGYAGGPRCKCDLHEMLRSVSTKKTILPPPETSRFSLLEPT